METLTDIRIIQLLGTYFLFIIGFCFFIIIRRIRDLELYTERLEGKIK